MGTKSSRQGVWNSRSGEGAGKARGYSDAFKNSLLILTPPRPTNPCGESYDLWRLNTFTCNPIDHRSLPFFNHDSRVIPRESRTLYPLTSLASKTRSPIIIVIRVRLIKTAAAIQLKQNALLRFTMPINGRSAAIHTFFFPFIEAT